MSRGRFAALVLGLALSLTACTAAPPEPGLELVLPATATSRPPEASPADAAEGTVLAEGEAVRQQDIDALAALWLPDGVLVDANHTADDAADDRRWEGWEAIRDRYAREVFPSYHEPDEGPRPRQSLPRATVTGDAAEVVVAGSDGRTTQDRWTLRLVDGVWRIAALEYNLAPILLPPPAE